MGGAALWERQEPRGPAGAQPLSAEPKATREARGARRRRAGCAVVPDFLQTGGGAVLRRCRPDFVPGRGGRGGLLRWEKRGDDPPFLRKQQPRGGARRGRFSLGKAGAEGEPAGAQPLSAEPKATREARGARRRRAGCARMPPAQGRGRRKIHPRRGQHGDIFSAIQRQQRQ